MPSKRSKQASHLEQKFDDLWARIVGIELQHEYKFHPKRKWRFDRAAPDLKLAIEIEGATFAQGRHTRGVGYAGDCEKYNAAALAGWVVVRLPESLITPEYLRELYNEFYGI